MKTATQSKVDNLVKTGFQVNIGHIFSRAGDIFKGIAGYAIAAIVIYCIVYYLLSIITGLIYSPDQEELLIISQSGDLDAVSSFYMQELNKPMYKLAMFISLIAGSVATPIVYSIYTMARKFDTQQKVEFSDIFIHYKDGKFFKLFLISIIISVGVSIATLFCVVPGFVVYVMWLIAVPFVVFADASIGEALSASRKLAFKSFGSFSLMLLLIIAVLFVGLLICCIGVIPAIPLTYVMIYVLYKDIVGFEDDLSEIDQIGTNEFTSSNNPYSN